VASLVDGIGNRRELMQADGIHPNLQAQPLIAERVWLQLQPMLEHGNNPGGD
jgi:acyl-CoA thioesterase-1